MQGRAFSLLCLTTAAPRRIRQNMENNATSSLDAIATLEAIIRQRRAEKSPDSYVARLALQGRSKLAQKLGEEAVETAIAAVEDDREALVSEAADLLFHLLMLLADADRSFDDVVTTLAARDGIGGLAEKASRAR